MQNIMTGQTNVNCVVNPSGIDYDLPLVGARFSNIFTEY